MNKEAQASALLSVPFDSNLPQLWVNYVQSSGFDPRPNVVWVYPSDCIFGVPVPLSLSAAHKLLSRSAQLRFSASNLLGFWINSLWHSELRSDLLELACSFAPE